MGKPLKMNPDDLKLIDKCQRHNDLKAFEILIKRHQNKVRGVIFKFVTCPEDLDDISQETFIKAFKALNTYNRKSSFSTWLCSIAINACKDRIRKSNTYNQKVISIEEHKLNELPDNQNADIEKLTNLNIEQKLVLKEINRLPESQKTAIILHDIEDFTYEEIATMTNSPVGTVKSRLFNARKTIKEKLKSIMSSIEIT